MSGIMFCGDQRESPESEDCWLAGCSEGGLIEKYLGGTLAIAFRRAELVPGEAIQDGFVILLSVPMLKSCPQSRETLMVSGDIELLGPKEGIAPFVSLCRFDCGSFEGGSPLFLFEHRYGSQKLGSSASNGEVGLAVGFYAVSRERDKISTEQLPIRVLRINLWDDTVWAKALPSHGALSHDWDMGIGFSEGLLHG